MPRVCFHCPTPAEAGGLAQATAGLRLAEKPLRCLTMTEIVLRVRLLGGDHLDVVYDESGTAEDDIVEHIISTLAQDGGALRCKHGGRLIVLYGRGVATVEVAPRGAVL